VTEGSLPLRSVALAQGPASGAPSATLNGRPLALVPPAPPARAGLTLAFSEIVIHAGEEFALLL
jgi:hypothetical protein